MKRCLYCYQYLDDGSFEFHPSCSRKLFGTPAPPELSYTSNDMHALATQVIQSQFAIPGVQPKLSLDVEKTPENRLGKFTVAGVWGHFIFKPPSEKYVQLPEVEDLTMHLATIAKIAVVPHSLIRMKDGKLAYITRRIDRRKIRNKVMKLHMEDMCQLTGRLTKDKYGGSYEQIAKAIWKFSSRPILDIVNFYEQVLHSFLTGNADMHLKNFSLLHEAQELYTLTPAYDMVSTALVLPGDKEELALHLNGKKNHIHRQDFVSAFNAARLEDKQQLHIFRKMESAKKEWISFIDISFLSQEFKIKYKEVIRQRFDQLQL